MQALKPDFAIGIYLDAFSAGWSNRCTSQGSLVVKRPCRKRNP